MSFDEDARPKKLKLRRIGLPKIEEDVIKKNLEPLKHYVEKKKRAQEAYYEGGYSQQSGTSPLTRNFNRRPVKQRLGGSRVPFRGTNTSDIPPKLRLHRLSGSTSNNVINRRKFRVNSLQQRLYDIRAMGQTSLIPHSTPNKIKLRRFIPNNLTKPQNFKVEVRNNNVIGNRQRFRHRRFKQILNYQIKKEIQNLQNEHRSDQRFPLTNVTPVTTNLKLNERFAALF